MRSVCAVMVWGGAWVGNPAWADMQVAISAIVTAPPACTINNNLDVTVALSTEMEASQIDGVRYAEPVPLTFRCTGTINTMDVSFIGTEHSRLSGVLRTSLADLGVRFLKAGNVQLNVREKVRVNNPNTPPSIRIAPIKVNGSSPVGTLSASATIQLDLT